MSIIYSTLERLEKLEKQSHVQAGRASLSNTVTEAHPPASYTKPGLSVAFKIVVTVMLCLGATAVFMLRTNGQAQISSSLFSQSQTLEAEPSIDAMPASIMSEATEPSLPMMAGADVRATDGMPAEESGEPASESSKPDAQPNDQFDLLDAGSEGGGELTPVMLAAIGSVETGSLQASAVELPDKASEPALSEIPLADDSADLVDNSAELAEAGWHASDELPADGHVNMEAQPGVAEARPAVTEAQPAVAEGQTAVVEAQPAVSVTTAEIRPDPIGQTLEQARLALSRGQYFQALADLESIPEVPENRADYWLIKGSVHLGLGQLELAEQSFESAQALVPGHAQTIVQLAVLKQEKGDHAGAIALLQDAAGRHRDVPEIYLNLGYSQQALGEFGEAGRSFRVFLQLTEGRTVYSEQRMMVSQWIARGPAGSGSVAGTR